MAAVDDKEKDLILHTVKVHVRENHLQGVDGKYVARVSNERTLYPEDIVQAMRTRGQYGGDTQTALDIINRYDLERIYQLLDGYRVADALTVVHPRVTGTLESPYDELDPEKNKIEFGASIRRGLKKFIKHIKLEKDDYVAPPPVHIANLVDHEQQGILPQNCYEPGDVIAIFGKLIKVEGTKPGLGVFFVPVDAPSQRVKMRLAENHSGRLTGVAPDTTFARNRIEIVTQHSGSKKLLDDPRVITSQFTVEAM